jgi:hypothetical protein
MAMLLGADPEFVFQRKGSVFVPANTVLKGSDFGYDGHSATGELRPAPAPTALQLTANIRALLSDGWKHEILNDLEMLAGHWKHGVTTGGHIHISGFRMEMSSLHDKLEMVLVRLSDCIDELNERAKRHNAGYGTGYRSQDRDWMEHRTPGSWLLSPQVTFLNLWLAQAVSTAYISRKNDAFEAIGKYPKCDGIIQFATALPDVTDQPIFLKVAEKTFSNLPLDWSEDMRANWS